MDDILEIKYLIEKLRARLYEKAEGKCFTDSEVLEASQELNQALNKYERLLSKKHE